MPRLKRRIHDDDDDDDDDGDDSSRFSESDDEKEEVEEENVPAIGDVGFQFRKQFCTGWFTGVVKAIIQNSEEPEYNRRCVYNDGDAEDLRLVDLVKLHKLDPRIKPCSGNAKITTNSSNKRQYNVKLFDVDSSEDRPPRRIGGKKHGSVEAGAKDVLAFNLESDSEFDDDADDDNFSNDEAGDDDNSDDEVEGTIGIADKRDDDVALAMDDERVAKAVRKHFQGKKPDGSWKIVGDAILMELKQYGKRILQVNRSGRGPFSPIIGYTLINDTDASKKIVNILQTRIYRDKPRNENEADLPTGTIDIAEKREEDVALTMDDKRFADAVRRYNQGTHKDYRSVAKKSFKRLKQYGGRLLQPHRSGTGRSPIIGYTSLNDADAIERIILMLNGNNMYRKSKWTQERANTKCDDKRNVTSISVKKNDLSHLKPVFESGENVCAAWWHKDMDVKDGSNAQWFYGKVSSYREKDKGSPYGPLRYYDILFNDGDASEGYGKSGLEEHWVMSSEDYDIYMKEMDWIGVRNERDDLVREYDLWPKMVGWYVVSGIMLQPSGKIDTVDGDDRTYARLSDAMKAYDMSVIRLKREDTRDSELNRFEKKKEYLEQIRLEDLAMEHNPRLPTHPPIMSRVKKNKNKMKKKKIVSDYEGVSYRAQDAKYLAEIDIDGKLYCLGPYTFQADAALAYDKGRKFLFTCLDPTGSNFSTMSKYEEAIRTEMANVNRNANVTKRNDMVTKIVQSYITKIYDVEPRRMPSTRTSYAELDEGDRDKDNNESDDESMNSSHDSVCVERRDDVLDRFFARGSTSHEECIDDHLAAQVHKPKAKYSIFNGVYQNGKSSRAQIFHAGKRYDLGWCWRLHADAALAYDKACKLLKGANCTKLNFTSRQSYLSHREKEIKKLEDSPQKVIIDPVPLVLSNIQHHLRSIMSSKMDALNKSFAEKWGEHLPLTIVGQDYHYEYQKSFNMLCANISVDDSCSPPTTPPNNSYITVDDEPADCITKDMEIDNIHDILVRPESTKDANNKFDDDASLFSSVHEASDVECPTTESPRASDVGGAHQNNPILSEDTEAEADQIKMPVGCPIMWNFLGDFEFCSGTVTSELDDREMYEVTPTNKGKIDSNKFIPASELAFGIGCPVFVSPTGGQGVQQMKGNVLFCTRKQVGLFLYTVVIIKGQNELQVMKGVSALRLRYRMVDSGVALMPAKTNNLVLPNNLQALMPPPRLILSPADGDNESGIFFSSNSTITTDCSATPSSRRLFRDSISTSSQDVKCCVLIPHWLVKNDSSRNRLFSYISQTDSIGTRMTCSLNIIEEGDSSYVLIRAKQGRYSTENIRKAAESLEHALMEYVGRHDGSVGRLFYDLARSCVFLYPLGGAGSTSVQQRNPFSTKNFLEMCWMNIVEIPVDRAQEIGLFIISKRAGLLRQISGLGCIIKVCGNLRPMVFTKFCAPYICVISDRPGQVDEVVAILRDAIRDRIGTLHST